MRFVDFLILLLSAHAETLKRLGAFFGEDVFIEMLENAGDTMDEALPTSRFAGKPGASAVWSVSGSFTAMTGNPYAELEGTVRELGLPEILQFHLWAYPHYRAFIESSIDLNARLPGNGGEFGPALIDEACAQAEAWARSLPIPPSVAAPALKAAQVPWIRFRTEALKKMGRRPLGAV